MIYLFAGKHGSKRRLEMDLQDTQRMAFAQGMWANLRVQWRALFEFLDDFALQEWPVSEHTICLFAQYLACDFKSPEAVKNYCYSQNFTFTHKYKTAGFTMLRGTDYL